MRGKKLLAIILCLSMCISLLPFPALAEEAPEDSEEVYADQLWTEESFEEEPESIFALPEEECEPEEPDPEEYEPELPEAEMLPEAEEASPGTDASDADSAEESENGTEAPAEEPEEELPDPTDAAEDTDSAADAQEEPTEEPGEESGTDEENDAPVEAMSASGTCGDNLTWTLDDTGLLVISGTGAMTDNYSPWGTSVRLVRIEQGVTSIGNSAFFNCRNLTSVTIPDSVTSIGDRAFFICSNLTNVTIPDSVTSIGNGAFQNCSNLTSVTIGNSVTSIGEDAFNNCSSLTNVTIPDSVTSIERSAFQNCSNLTSVTIPDSVTSIGSYAFYSCSSLTNVTIPDSVTSIGSYAFYSCRSLTNVTIPDSVTSIGDHAFFECSSLTSVTIGKGVTSIGETAFYNCSSLTSVTIPESVTSIGQNAFYNCSSLTSVTIPESVVSIDGYAFYQCSSLTSVYIHNLAAWCRISFNGNYANPLSYAHTLYLDGMEIKDLVIPSGITSIKQRAFSDCSSLTSVTIPDSVTSIGDHAFSRCSSLTSMTIPDSVTSIGGGAFSVCSNLTSVTIPDSVTSIGSYAFSSCSSLTSMTIPDNVTNIENRVFSGCSNLTSVTIPDSVTSIGEYAFYACSSLTSVTIGNSVTSIGEDTFYACSSLTSVTIPASVTSIGRSTFYGCSRLREISLEGDIPSIGSSAFSGVTATVFYPEGNATYTADNMLNYDGALTWKALPSGTCGNNLRWMLSDAGLLVISGTGVMTDYSSSSAAPWGTEIKSLRIEQGVTSIGDHAFFECSSLTSVTIGKGVTSIGLQAFHGCSSLTSVTIPNSVTSIGASAFSNCSNLMSVTIPDSVTNIEQYTFYCCSSLRSVTIPDSVTSIGQYALAVCNSLTSVTIGNNVTSIGEHTFYACSSLTNVTIPASVTSIEGKAFCNCTRLREISLEGDMPSVDSSAFSGVTATVLYPRGNATYTSDNMLNYGGTLTWKAFAFGTCGDNLRWTLNDTGLLVISGTGAMTNYSSSSEVPWGTDVKSVWIEQGVTSIGNRAFYFCTSLTSVTIPESMTNIGNSAFSLCIRLTSLTIPDNVTSIGSGAFVGCISLTAIQVTDGNSVYTSVDGVLYNKNRTELIAAPGGLSGHFSILPGVTSIGNSAFSNCSKLASVTIPNSVVSIGDSAFSSCSKLASVTIPDGVMNIGRSAFDSCTRLTNVTIPDSVTSIERSAFQNCSSLTSVTIPVGVTSIGILAFSNCSSLTSLTIPDSVTSIGSWAFEDCSSLTTITLEGDMPSIGSSAFSGVTATVLYPEGNATYTAGNMVGYGGTLTWEAIPMLDPDWSGLPEELTLDRGYLLLKMSTGETEVTLETNLTYPAYLARVKWTTESGTENVISVSGGTVTAKGPGTDYVVATLNGGERTLTARCRIDVLDEEQQGKEEILVILPEKQVSTELFKTDYSRFSVVLRLEQNVRAADVTLKEETDLEDTGVAITGAEFVGGGKQDIRDAFRLRVVDDRTLEIIPIIDLNDAAEVKGVAKSYKSSVRLTLSNGRKLTTPELTLKVGKTLPKLKAAAVKLNSFIDGHTAPVIITGGRVKSFTSSADAKASALATIGSDLTVTVIGTEIKGSGKFSLSCELEDWAVHANVTVPVNVTYTAPKVTLKPASVSLKAEVYNSAETVLTLVPLPGMSHSVTVEGVSGLSAAYDEASGKITVLAGSAAPGTYKVPVLADGKQVAVLTVKVLPKNSQVSLTAKATGAIDTAVPNSPVVITVGGKNCNPTEGEYTVEILQTNKKLDIVDQPADSRFNIVKSGNVVTVTGDPEMLKDKVEGYTYSARISSEILGAKPATVKFTVKASKKAPAASVTLKAAGSIDVLRPGTEVVVTPNFKNWYGYDLSKATLSLDTSLFEYEPVDGKFVIRPVYGAEIDPKAGYTVSMTLDGYTTKAVKLPVKMGAVKIGQSAKELTLLKNDRFDRQSVKLTLDDDTLYDIDGARVELDAKSADKYSLTKLDSGEYAIGYKDNVLPESVTGSSVTAAAVTPDDTVHADAGGGVTDPTGPVDIGGGKPKSDAVKLNVFLTGNGGSKPNQVITVKLKLT